MIREMFVATSTSAAMRYLISTSLNLAAPTAKVFNAIDMTIGFLASAIFKDRPDRMLAAKIVGTMTAAVITNLYVGPIDVIFAFFISGLSTFTGTALSMMTGDIHPDLVLV